jgi:hypothetical protein
MSCILVLITILEHQLLDHDPGCATDGCLRTLLDWGIKPDVVPHASSGTRLLTRSFLSKISLWFCVTKINLRSSTDQSILLERTGDPIYRTWVIGVLCGTRHILWKRMWTLVHIRSAGWPTSRLPGRPGWELDSQSNSNSDPLLSWFLLWYKFHISGSLNCDPLWNLLGLELCVNWIPRWIRSHPINSLYLIHSWIPLLGPTQ